MVVPSTGDWQTWTDLVKTVNLSAGTQVMRVSCERRRLQPRLDRARAFAARLRRRYHRQRPLTIYADALAADWSDWSWGAINDFAATANVKTGTRALDVSYYAWGGLSLRKTTAVRPPATRR